MLVFNGNTDSDDQSFFFFFGNVSTFAVGDTKKSSASLECSDRNEVEFSCCRSAGSRWTRTEDEAYQAKNMANIDSFAPQQ